MENDKKIVERQVRSKNLITLIALMILVVLFYGLAIVRLKII